MYDYLHMEIQRLVSVILMSENRIVIIDTLLRLLVCIAVSHRGLTDEEWEFMRRLEKELFDDE